MTLKELANQTARQFVNVYGRQPCWLAAAPGRVNLIGEHTDYNDGFVFPMAIERYVTIAADRPNPGTRLIRLYSTHSDKPVIINLAEPLKPYPPGSWGNYPLGVIAGFLARGLNPGGFDALIYSTVPLGGGLSSSAALEVAMATLLEISSAGNSTRWKKRCCARRPNMNTPACRAASWTSYFRPRTGKPGPVLDCRSRKPELVPMTDPAVTVLIINTNVKHELTGSEYPARRKQCETAAKNLGLASLRDATADVLEQARGKMDKIVFRRARHVIGEIERTVHAAEGVRAANWQPSASSCMPATLRCVTITKSVARNSMPSSKSPEHRHQRRNLRLPHDRRRFWRLCRGPGEERRRQGHHQENRRGLPEEDRHRTNDICLPSRGRRLGAQRGWCGECPSLRLRQCQPVCDSLVVG